MFLSEASVSLWLLMTAGHIVLESSSECVNTVRGQPGSWAEVRYKTIRLLHGLEAVTGTAVHKVKFALFRSLIIEDRNAAKRG